MMKKLLLTLSLLGFFSGAAIAGDCQRLSSVCVDATPVKNIQGLNVTVEQVGGCWAFEDTYQCRSAATVNDCQPLRDRGCAQIGTKCVDKDDSGTCVMYEAAINARTSLKPTPRKRCAIKAPSAKTVGQGASIPAPLLTRTLAKQP